MVHFRREGLLPLVRLLALAALLGLPGACSGGGGSASTNDVEVEVAGGDTHLDQIPWDGPAPTDGCVDMGPDELKDQTSADLSEIAGDLGTDLISTCGPGEALHGNLCIPCAAPCDAAGETGILWPLASKSGKCVCETEDGWYYTEGIDIGTYPCDLDGDGWVAESARLSVESSDPAIQSNARCDVRRIDRLILENEDGETRTALLPELVPNFEGDSLALYEPNHLDDESLQKWADLPAYGERPLSPAELNPLVRFCADADFNGNGIKDFQEWHDVQAEVPANPHLAPFAAFAFFGELHRGWYEAPDADQLFGAYHVRERARRSPGADTDEVPVVADEAYELEHGASSADQVARLYQCLLWPRPGYDPEDTIPEINRDFQRLGPEVPTMDFARSVEVAPGELQVVPEDHWDGMNLHSQFRCVQFVNTPPEDPAVEPNKLVIDAFSDEAGRLYQFNQCGATSDPEGAPISSAPVQGQNPLSPQVHCEPLDVADLEGGTVGWAMVRYREGPYLNGGCVDQCAVSTGCGLCGRGVWLSADGQRCGLETDTAGYGGIPSACEDIQHPDGLSWEGYVCDDCPWQETCDDGDDCSINLCHQDAEGQCAPPIPTPDDFPCPDDGSDCTSDYCAAGTCTHPALPYGTPCAGAGQCKEWTCGGVEDPATEPGICSWSPKTNQDCTLEPANDCMKSKCNAEGTCGKPKAAGVVCASPVGGDDGNVCTAPACDGDGQCLETFVGEGEPCDYDDNECTIDQCTWITGEGPVCYAYGQGANGTPCTTDVPVTCDESVCQSGACVPKGSTCNPGQSQTCNICGSKECTDLCQWGDCTDWQDHLDAGDFPSGSMNDSKMTATDLGTYNDDPAPGDLTTYGTLVPGNDVDWYKLKINDTCCEEYPKVVVYFFFPAGVTPIFYEVGASWECVNNANNKQEWDNEAVMGWTAHTFEQLDCDGGADDVYLYIGIAYSDATTMKTCQEYHFVVDFY